MVASPPRPPRRRPRPGSLERPVNARLYRGTWLLVGIPLLIAAFSVRKVEPLPAPQPALPPSFDRGGALTLATELAQLYPDRAPGTAGALGAAGWFRAQLAPYGLGVVADRFRAELPGRGTKILVNQLVTVPGRSSDEIVVMAHRDDEGSGPGANDNASGLATLIELAQSYGTPVAAPRARPVSPLHTLVFVATDGGAFGGLGARRFAETHRGHVLAVIDLSALAGRGPPLLVVATNPFALLFLLPSLHAWLWLPQFRRHPLWIRAALLAAGLLGPLLLLGSLAWRYDLGIDAFWYLSELTATGYVKLPA